MKNFIDRQPEIPNRRLITPDTGTPFYATITFADNAPIDKSGTTLNRLSMMALQGFYGNVTVFNADGSITETNQDGDTKVTVFNVDGSISETFTSGTMSITKTTTFNPDGSIAEIIS